MLFLNILKFCVGMGARKNKQQVWKNNITSLHLVKTSPQEFMAAVLRIFMRLDLAINIIAKTQAQKLHYGNEATFLRYLAIQILDKDILRTNLKYT